MRSSTISHDSPGSWLRVLGILVGSLVFSASASYAIDPHRAMSQYVRDRWGPEQGFPRGPVYAITQTTDGYLWIGTGAGLLRFDGLSFRLIRDELGSFAFTGVLGLVADRDGSLWIQLRDTSLIRYRNGRFDDPFSSGKPVSNITAIARTQKGELLAARLQLGAFGYGNGQLQPLARAAEVPRSPVLAVSRTGDGSYWLGTRSAGLFQLQGGQTIPVRRGLTNPKVDCLLPDGVKDMWIGTDDGLVRWNGTELTSAGIPAVLKNFQALAIVKDRDANIWIGTDSRGLLRFNAGGVAGLDQDNKGQRNAVTTVFEDREGSLWVGSVDGVERLRDSPFVTFSSTEGLPTEGNNPVFVDGENRIWFPPVAGGLWWFRDGRHGTVSQGGLNRDIVYSLAGGKEELWLGRQRGGLTRLRPAKGLFEAKTFTTADGLAQNSVYSLLQSRDGAVWAGTLSGGVSRLANGKFTTFTMAQGLASNTVASMLETADGTMWFATPGGLSALAQDKWRTFASGDGLPSENINCLYEDSGGVLWAGTTAGLAFRAAGRFRVPAKTPASMREQILGLAEDKFGSLWMATSNHVLRVNRDRLLAGDLLESDVRQYGFADGLRGTGGVKRHRTVVTDSAGRIWFSLDRGISVVDPARLTRNSVPAVAHIQSLSADGRSIESGTGARITPGRHRIVFGFVGLAFSAPERVRFRYKLDGLDDEWTGPVTEREVAYTNLGPGAYRFRVVASNPDGIWNPREDTVSFGIEAAFWQTWWFRLAALLACTLAGIALYRFRLRQVGTQLSVRFEERLAERVRIAQELHDTLLQGFLSAAMQVDIAVDRLPPDSAVKPSLTRALALMRQVTEEGRNAVRGLRSTQSASLDLEQAFSRIQEELADGEHTGSPVEFQVVVEGTRRALRPVLRDEVYRIGREALTNAFRHSRARKIEIEITYSSSSLRVVVRDDGCGLDPQTLHTGRDGHWGLSGMRERADRIHAHLHLRSGAMAGTEIELSVPAHIAFGGGTGSLRSWIPERYRPGNFGRKQAARIGERK